MTFKLFDREAVLDDLKKLGGLPPYDDGGNPCRGDGYFARSLEKKYGMSVETLKQLTGYDRQAARWEQLRKEFGS